MTHEFDKDTQFDLVTTSYAHPAMPQLAFYERISASGTFLMEAGHQQRRSREAMARSRNPFGGLV